MNYSLYFLTSILYFVWLVRTMFFWTHLWQIKEYRLDRMLVHLYQTTQGRRLIFSPLNVVKNLFFIVSIILVAYSSYEDILSFVVFIIYGFCFFEIVEEVKNKKLKIPVFTLKTLFILIVVFLLEFTLYQFALLNSSFWLLFLDRITSFLIAFFIGIFWVPSELYKDYLVYLARLKRQKLRSLQVIGITGSYGKGSTKEYVSHILSKKYGVSKTPKSINTLIGIAKTILSSVNPKTNIFIAEMGAYKIGEIREMCEMTQPNIGILTSVNQQHISLFGSIENTIKAKYELIEGLAKNGMALFNGNNANSYLLYKKTQRHKKILYYVDYDNTKSVLADILANNIKQSKFFLECDIYIGSNKLVSAKIPILGLHMLENILPAVFLANHFKINAADIKNQLLSVKSPDQTMMPYKTSKGVILVDDTFNANPASVISAASYMKMYTGKKVMVLQPMIELGKDAEKIHYDTIFKISKICDYIFLTNSSYFEAIKRAVDESARKTCKLVIFKPEEIVNFVEKNLKKDDVVVFENKEAVGSLSRLQYEKIN